MNKKEQPVRQQWSKRERESERAAVKPGNSCPAMSSMGLKVYLKYVHIFPLQSSVFNNLANTHTHTHIFKPKKRRDHIWPPLKFQARRGEAR